MTISIVIPVYNVQGYLEACLESIINQSYKDIEIILVNDGSTDRSIEICEKYISVDSRIKLIHKENGGQSEARNFGIKEAVGEWLTFIDADDYVTSDYVEYLYTLIQEYSADISIGSFTYVTKNKNTDHSTGEVTVMDTETAIKRMLLNDGYDMGVWAKMYRTEYFKKNNFPVGKLFEDSLTTYEVIAESKKVVLGSKSIYYYVNRSDSTVNSSFNMKKFDLIEMNLKNEIFIKTKFPNLSLAAHRRVIWAYFSTLNQLIVSNDKKVIDKYGPDLITYLLSQGNFILKNSFVPLRDKIGYCFLKLFGIRGYKSAWTTYLRITR
ncbi:glycosyltransferase family 2 protein [Enterococcus sp. AZ163]|uniref:glycosyltransferase family 2 protein n=1 Tax=Enterococcus sp. AZ163 TaxID=2774638 RepID=UPI003D26EA2E